MSDGAAPAGGVRAMALAVVLVLVAVLGWLAWERPWRPHGTAGEVLELADGRVPTGSAGPSAEMAIDVATPGGVWTLTVGEPRDRLDDGDWEVGQDAVGADRYAPRGSSYLPIAWARSGEVTAAGVPTVDLGGDAEPPPRIAELGEPEVAIRTGDGEPLAGPFDLLVTSSASARGDGVAVLVDDPDDVRVVLTWDGHTQSVDVGSGEVEAGVAAPYYDELASGNEPEAVACEWSDDLPAAVAGDLAVGRLCEASVQRSPWSAAGGWVDSTDQAWLSATAQVRVPTSVDDGDEVFSLGADAEEEPVITLDRQEPRQATELLGPDAVLHRWWAPAVWPVATTDDVGPVVVEVPVVMVDAEDELVTRGTVTASIDAAPSAT